MSRCISVLFILTFAAPAALISALQMSSAVAVAEPIVVPRGQRQLFLDDFVIEKTEQLVRQLHQPDKRGAVIRSVNPSQTIQTRTAPVWDPEAQLFKLWVMSTDQPLRLSEDGLHWTAGPVPNLRIDHAVYDPRDADPARRFKAALLNEGFAVSADGIQWTKLDVPAVPSSDEGNFSYDPHEGLFIHTVKRGGPFGRSVAIATSSDFRKWYDYGVVFHADELDQELGRQRIAERLANPSLKQTEYNTPEHYSVQVYNMGVFRYEGLYIGLPSIYHHTGKVPPGWPGFDKLRLSPAIRDAVDRYGDYTGFYNIQVAVSRDLQDWERVAERAPFLTASPLGAGAYDVQTIIGPSAPVVRDDEIWFYYTGIKHYAFVASGNEPGHDDYRPDKGAVCLAVLRRDGFISLDADAVPGTLLTRPLLLGGPALHVNVAAEDGELVVTVLDTEGQTLAVSEPVTGDQLRAAVRWKSVAPDSLGETAVRLQFTLRNAQLYSFWCDSPSDPGSQ
ncbi:MAG: hypothetical protein JNG89_09990 [Planctomycetaceae bacterium]|nr:hypothetical protein [Planctomycetaceae bacterium]